MTIRGDIRWRRTAEVFLVYQFDMNIYKNVLNATETRVRQVL